MLVLLPFRCFSCLCNVVPRWQGGALLFLLFAVACGNPKPKPKDFDKHLADCPKGAPTSLLSDKTAGMKAHSFVLHDAESVETVAFDDGTTLEVVQTGCEHIRQEFAFTEPSDEAANLTDARWCALAAKSLRTLSHRSAALEPIGLWATMLEAHLEDFKRGQPLELEPHHYLTVDGIQTGAKVETRIALSED